jgi:hypothetical protein
LAVQRTSESIGTLAAALAKAQCELVNPEKSLTATIQSDSRNGKEETFNYASLASGLEIVRKTLGQQEIAVAQTTSIDQTSGIVNLTTVLAHSSGEWIASDWPVCPISDTATPQRMGKALTYARRYALFTLVGIAGEDDLDAPDLAAPAKPRPEPEEPRSSRGSLNGNRIPHRAHAKPAEPSLDAHASAELRDRLVAEIDVIETRDNAATWAHRRLPEKNKLTAPDAQQVEVTFGTKLATLPNHQDILPLGSNPQNETKSKKRPRPRTIDKSVLALPEPRRMRDRDHVKSVAKHPCLICGRKPADAHHLRFAQSRALGRKVSDEFTVPLCRGHHREVHRCGDEIAWWMKTGIDPTVTARALWLESHPLVPSPPVRRTGLVGDVARDIA